MLVIARLSEYRAYFAQRDSKTHVVELLAMLIAYTIAIFLADRFKGLFGAGVFRIALVAGLVSGLIEVLTIASENAGLAFKVPPLLGMLSVFAAWGVAGFWAMFALRSMKAAVSTAVVSAAICCLSGRRRGLA